MGMSFLTTQVNTSKDGWIENTANKVLEPVRFCLGGRYVHVIDNSTVLEVGQVYQLPLQTKNPSKDYKQTAQMVALLIPSLIVGFVLRLISLRNPDVRFGCFYQEKPLPGVEGDSDKVEDSLIRLKDEFDGFYKTLEQKQWSPDPQLLDKINQSITQYFESTNMLLKKAERVDKKLIAGYLYAYHMMRNQTDAYAGAVGCPLFENVDQRHYFNPLRSEYRWRQQYNLICKQLEDLDIRRPTDPIFFKWTKPDLAPFLPDETREFPLFNLVV